MSAHAGDSAAVDAVDVVDAVDATDAVDFDDDIEDKAVIDAALHKEASDITAVVNECLRLRWELVRGSEPLPAPSKESFLRASRFVSFHNVGSLYNNDRKQTVHYYMSKDEWHTFSLRGEATDDDPMRWVYTGEFLGK